MVKFTYAHLHFRSETPEVTAKFYCDNFGAVVKSKISDSGTVHFLLELEGAPLMAVSGCADGETPVPGSTEPRYGLDHIGFEVDDMDSVVTKLKANGVHFILEPRLVPSGSKIAFVEAPDKTSIEITQNPSN